MADPIQDNIDFALVAEETVVNDTVKLTADISGIVTPGLTEDSLKTRIREMMRQLVGSASWQFANVIRQNHGSGMEEIALQASARVHEKENYGLERRAREVSREGLSVVSISADPTPPQNMIEKAERELRVTLLKKTREELSVINAAMGETYRIGSVTFQSANNASFSNARSSKTVSASSYGSGFDEENDLGNAVKLTLRAQVSFRKTPN